MAAVFGLVNVIVRVDVPLSPIVPGLKLVVTVGAVIGVKVTATA